MKEDAEVGIISADALFLVAKAAEMFLSEVSVKAFIHARYDRRKTLSYKDVARHIKESESLEFLEDHIPDLIAVSEAIANRREAMKELSFAAQEAPLDQSQVDLNGKTDAHPVHLNDSNDDNLLLSQKGENEENNKLF